MGEIFISLPAVERHFSRIMELLRSGVWPDWQRQQHKAAAVGTEMGAKEREREGGFCLKTAPGVLLRPGQQQMEGRTLAVKHKVVFARTRTGLSFSSLARQLLIRSPQTGRQEINAGL